MESDEDGGPDLPIKPRIAFVQDHPQRGELTRTMVVIMMMVVMMFDDVVMMMEWRQQPSHLSISQ